MENKQETPITEGENITDDIYKPIFFTRLFGMLAVGIVVLILSSFQKLDFAPWPTILILFPFIAISVAHWFIFIRGKAHSIVMLYFLLLIDLSVITAVVYLSGGIHSSLSFLYLIVIISAALISVRAVTTFSLATILSYGIIGYTDYFKINGFLGFEPDEVTQIAMFAVLAVIIGTQSYYYMYRIKSKDKKMMELKNQFLFTTVHDIRSPAIAIKWTLEKYKKPEFVDRYPEIQYDISLADSFANRTLNLAEKLLLLAKGEEAKIKKEPLDIVSVINNILKEVEPGIAEKSLKVEYEASKNLPQVLANAELLKEAIGNIVGNAVKYNKQDGKVVIKHDVEDKFLRTTIMDTGPQISPTDLRYLFTPYFRGDEDKKIKGTGLGLYITKRIIENMGGTVGIKSSSENSTVFYVTMPIAGKGNDINA